MNEYTETQENRIKQVKNINEIVQELEMKRETIKKT